MMNKTLGNCLRAMGLAALLSLCLSMTVLADTDSADRFPKGTDVNGVLVGGLTVDEAKSKIESSYAADYKLIISENDGKTETLTGPEIGLSAVIPGGLQEILNGQNDTGRQSGPSAGNSYTLPVQASFDEAALKAGIQSLSCVSGDDITVTADAHISPYQADQPFTIIPEVQGNNVDPQKVEAAVKDAAAAGRSTLSLSDSGCYVSVQVTKEDEQLINLCDTMNRCREMTITYTVGDQTVKLNGETICSWLTGTQAGQIMVKPDEAATFVAALAARFDTANSPRVLTTASGREVTLNGSYGWILNQQAETAALIAMIQTGQSQTREPEFAQTAASHTGPDWGNTYVEIDMAEQHVYMYQDGQIVWDAPTVTGNVSKGLTTPEGIYTLNYKEKDRVLRGPKKADGTYEYESHVNYWMPFNGGIGLHDASWRGKFGGSIYRTNGSHGCINLPPSKTKTLYDLVYKGIPILCHN